MSVSGCTSCQLGGVEALKAYDRAFQVKLNNDVNVDSVAAISNQAAQSQPTSQNNPIAGATVGSTINISA